jgi:hypothetical protein
MSWSDELLKKYNIERNSEEPVVQPLIEEPSVQKAPNDISWSDKLLQEKLGVEPIGPSVETGDGTIKAICRPR